VISSPREKACFALASPDDFFRVIGSRNGRKVTSITSRDQVALYWPFTIQQSEKIALYAFRSIYFHYKHVPKTNYGR
jgi:hypothetical protein